MNGGMRGLPWCCLHLRNLGMGWGWGEKGVLCDKHCAGGGEAEIKGSSARS